MAIELIERDGRYFVQCSDGEVEVNLEELKQQDEAADAMMRYWRLWKVIYGHHKWAAKDVPVDAGMHLRISLLFENARTCYQKQFDAGESMEIPYRVCDFCILETKAQLANPYANRAVLAPMLTGWELLKEWLDFLTSRPLLSCQPLNITSDTPTVPTSPEELAAAFWEALRRISMLVEWENNSPRYTVPVHLLGYDDFNEDLRALRGAFEAALPKLKTKHLRLLRGELGELLSIDRQSFRRREALYNEQKYALQFLPDDYPILRFEVAEPGRGLASPWQWVNPSIWTDFVVLMQYKQEVARAIYDKISAALDKPPYPFPITAPLPDNPAIETPAPPVAAYPWAEIEALAVRIELRKAGRFTPAGKLVASAVAGLIDALREAEMLPAAATLPTLYAAFGHHYKCPVGADRITATRDKWQRTARKELGLD